MFSYRPQVALCARGGICECVAVPPACCHCASRALPGVRCQMQRALACACMRVRACGRTGGRLSEHPLMFSRSGELHWPGKVPLVCSGMKTHVSFGSCVFLERWSARTVCKGGVSVGTGGQRECRAKRDGRSPVSVSAAVLRRHKVTLCFPAR